MADFEDAPLPTPYDGWDMAANAFDLANEPAYQVADDAEDHGRRLVLLHVSVDENGRIEGRVQLVRPDFATDIADPQLAELIADATATVDEHHHDRCYLEVEYYEDGTMLFFRLFDAAGLDELERRLNSDPDDDMDADEFFAQFPDDEDDDYAR